jgi:hypothetical protein
VPSVESVVNVTIFIISLFRNALVVVAVAGRNVGNDVLVVDNSVSVLNMAFDGLSEDSVTNSGRSESVKIQFFLGEDVFNVKVKSSNSSESTTERVTSDIEVPTLMSLSNDLHGFNEFVLEDRVIIVHEIFRNLSTGGLTESTVNGVRVFEFTGKLNDVGGTTESNNESLTVGVSVSRVRDRVLVRKEVLLKSGGLETGQEFAVVTTTEGLVGISITVRSIGNVSKFLGHLFIETGNERSG